ncbi:apoptosis-associated speck-like protein containing a CARD [Elgaria multicarinata webbii]|uniref:apoptosis-associated speck-like protein containing a CARD n=1 Tax=Elgaria multicarinata webbii TaxID=159646 RepID=UPI002FCD5591
MTKAVRDHLLNALEDLDQVQFKRFKWRLGGFDLGKRRIPRGLLEPAGALDLSDLLLSFYREDGAVTVTAAVLEAINCRRQAEGLLSATRDGIQPSDPLFSTLKRPREPCTDK